MHAVDAVARHGWKSCSVPGGRKGHSGPGCPCPSWACRLPPPAVEVNVRRNAEPWKVERPPTAPSPAPPRPTPLPPCPTRGLSHSLGLLGRSTRLRCNLTARLKSDSRTSSHCSSPTVCLTRRRATVRYIQSLFQSPIRLHPLTPRTRCGGDNHLAPSPPRGAKYWQQSGPACQQTHNAARQRPPASR